MEQFILTERKKKCLRNNNNTSLQGYRGQFGRAITGQIGDNFIIEIISLDINPLSKERIYKSILL